MSPGSDAAATPPVIEADALAGRGARLGAFLLDVLIVLAIAVPVSVGLDLVEGLMDQDAGALVRTTAVGIIAYAIVNGYPLAQRGQTLGKMAVGVRIVSARTGAIVPLWNSLGVRYALVQIIIQIPVAGVVFALADALCIFGERRRCLHDFLAGTEVVEAQWAGPGGAEP